jgi:hypothetical protein
MAISRLLVPVVAALMVLATLPGAAHASGAQPGGKLFVGGNFTEAGGVTATSIAAWDGVDWAALEGPNGEGADSSVTAMVMYNGKLVVGGSFVEAGGEVVSGIATWDGTDWEPLIGSSGVPGVTILPLGFVSALAVYNGDLYVGGMFPRAGATTTVNNLARWNGTEWSAVTGPSGFGVEQDGSDIAVVWDMVVVDGVLVVGGGFDTAGGVAVNNIASWNGSSWASLGQPIEDAAVLAVTTYQGKLVATRDYVVNNFNVADVASYSNGVWTQVGGASATTNTSPRDLVTYNNFLVVSGHFTQYAGITVNHIAKWDGATWSAVSGPSGTGANGVVRALAVHAGNLIAGGFFTSAGGVSVSNIAKWNGSAWSALAGATAGTNEAVFTLLST